MLASKHQTILKTTQFNTPLGPMIAISDETTLYLLEFTDRRNLDREIEKLKAHMNASIIPDLTAPLASIKAELKSYFEGTLTEFKTPFHLFGTTFQQLVWTELTHIPYGHTTSYLEQAKRIGKPAACRAVANANGTNQLAIIIPCHRIINSNGKLGGYGAGLTRKQWLLDHEKAHSLKKG